VNHNSEDIYFKLGILGHPLSHTLSPILHQALLEETGLSGEYRPYDVPPELLHAELQKFARAGGRGLNVTIPHKVTVIPLLDTVSQNASLLGAVNTVIFQEGGTLHGENTDIIGFTSSLPASLISQLKDQHVLLLGAGGSARAVLAGLIQLGTQKITIVARHTEKASFLKQAGLNMVTTYQSKTQLETCLFSELEYLNFAQGIVNTTPVGMSPHPDESPLSKNVLKHLFKQEPENLSRYFVYDLIYKPKDTQLLKMAQNMGIQTFNGLDMLILQGVAAFKLWTHSKLPSSESFLEGLRQALSNAIH
jgi:shikimate dehydrogenase